MSAYLHYWRRDLDSICLTTAADYSDAMRTDVRRLTGSELVRTGNAYPRELQAPRFFLGKDAQANQGNESSLALEGCPLGLGALHPGACGGAGAGGHNYCT